MVFIFCISRLSQGGAGRQVYETVKLLADAGHQVYVCIYSSKMQYYQFDEKVKVIDLQVNLESGNSFIRFWKLYNVIRRIQPDFAISYLETANKYLGRIGSFSKKLHEKTVFIGSERNTVVRYSDSKKKLKKFCAAYQGFDAIITNSKLTKQNIIKDLGWEEHKVFVLRNVLNTELFKRLPVPREEWSTISNQVRTGDCLILVPARIMPQKNQKILIKVAEILFKNQFNKFQFLLAGNEIGTYAEEMREEVKSKDLTTHFQFLGTIPEPQINKLYNLVDIVLLPSLWEGLSNAIIEALACSQLVISTKVSDIEDLITDGKNGFLVDINSAEQISERILEIVSLNPERKRTIQINARETALSLRPEIYLNNFYNILKQVKPAASKFNQ